MKFKILYSLILSLLASNIKSVSEVVYLQSAFSDNNPVLAEAIIRILPESKAKDGAIKKFNNTFPQRPYKSASGLSLEDRQKLIANASKELKDLLDKKDLSKESDLTEVLQFIAGPQGSGGKLAKQIGPKQTLVLADTLVKSS